MSDDETYRSGGRDYYKATDNPVWPARHRERPSANPNDTKQLSPLTEDSCVRLLLTKLDGLEKKTRPSIGSTSAERKDFAAFEALELAGELVQYIAGWAIDHQVGLAIEGLKFVPMQPSGTRQHPIYRDELSRVDSHAHEKAGAKPPEEEIANPLFLRNCAVNLLRASAGAMPDWLRRKLIGGLEALDYGEVQPMLAPINDWRKRDLTLLRLQLQALAFVAYRRKLGSTKKKALKLVSDVLGVSPHTLLSWESRLRNEFGRLAVDGAISFAENHASWVADARKVARKTGELAKDTQTHEAGFDDAALADLNKKYQAALRAVS